MRLFGVACWLNLISLITAHPPSPKSPFPAFYSSPITASGYSNSSISFFLNPLNGPMMSDSCLLGLEEAAVEVYLFRSLGFKPFLSRQSYPITNSSTRFLTTPPTNSFAPPTISATHPST